MKSTLVSSIYLVITLILIIGTVVFRLLPATMPVASAEIVTIGVGVYWDKDCTNLVSSIEWGTLGPGAKEDKTVYVRNEGNSTITLSLATRNWNPVNASDFISLSWNYRGETISPNEVLRITLTLSISLNIKGITSFSFEIVITYVRVGLLKIETNPPVPATLYIGGTSVDPWGLDYLPLPPGNYTVRFGDVPYYVTPPSQNVTIQADEVKVVVGSYVKAGLLKVETSPPVPGVIYVNGIARAVWGLDYLPVIPGVYNVSFGNVDGFVTPQFQIVSVLRDQVTTVVGNYTASEVSYPSPPHGFLKIETDPPMPATLYLDDVPVDPWGLDYLPLPPGVYRIRFGDAPEYVGCYVTPPEKRVTIIQDQVTVVVGHYIRGGLLKVETSPAVPSVIYVNGTARAVWGLDYLRLAPGTYLVSFGEVPGFVTPPVQIITIEEDKVTVVVGNFTGS